MEEVVTEASLEENALPCISLSLHPSHQDLFCLWSEEDLLSEQTLN